VVAVIDYGMGNLRSVLNAFDLIEAEARLADAPEQVDGAERVVIPGVGAFPDAMAALDERGLTGALRDYAASGRPILGICLGMQLLATRSMEYGDTAGLDLVPGTVELIDPEPSLRIPHVGWNDVEVTRPSPILEGWNGEVTCYFVHSYELRPDDAESVTATADYGRPITACVERDNVYGAQFHPEKSAGDGLRLLRNFVALA
jgi:glutamine amidotransferase